MCCILGSFGTFELLSSLFVLYSFLYPQLKNNIRKIFNKFLWSMANSSETLCASIWYQSHPTIMASNSLTSSHPSSSNVHPSNISPQISFLHSLSNSHHFLIHQVYQKIKVALIGKLDLFHVPVLQSVSITLWLQILQSSLGLIKANS